MTSPHASAPMLKLSPNSIDMGYHTMVTTTESPPPFREPPPPAPPTQLILEPQQLRVSYKKKSPFDLLSDDLLVRIFKFLPKNHLGQCAQVCRRFYFLAWEPQLWQSIDLQVKNNCDGTLQVLLKHLSRDVTCSQSVLKVCLNNSSGLTDKGIRILAQHCPNLRHFSVHNCKTISNAGIQSLLDQCPSLSHLDLTGKQILVISKSKVNNTKRIFSMFVLSGSKKSQRFVYHTISLLVHTIPKVPILSKNLDFGFKELLFRVTYFLHIRVG